VALNRKDLDRLQQAGLQDSIERSQGISLLKAKPNGLCSQLSDEWLCSIYSNRPFNCRAYPFIVNPGFEDNLILDISMRCPFVNTKEPKITKAYAIKKINLAREHIASILTNSIRYRTTLAEHIRACYRPAFMKREERVYFMDEAIERLLKSLNEGSPTAVSIGWYQGIEESVRVTLEKDIPPVNLWNKEILDGLEISESDHAFKRHHWRIALEDVKNNLSLPGEAGLRFHKTKAVLGGIKSGKEKYSFKSLDSIGYEKAAIEELGDYLKLMVRRAGYELSVLNVSENLIKIQGVASFDYEIGPMLLSRSVISHFDMLCRIIARIYGHESIKASDAKNAINNMDGPLLISLMNGYLAVDMIGKLDVFRRSSD
jgi:Fe-S-cluster containining protein